MNGAGLCYRIVSPDQATIKGRILGALSSHAATAENFWALREVTLDLKHGEVVGVVGPNGSGKSTLLRLMARIMEPSEGSVETQGRVGALLDISSTLSANLTGRQNAYLYGSLQRIPRAQLDEMMPRIQEFAEIGPFFDVPMKTYSSGMAARVGFAMATMMQPDVLLVDEVLSVGDERFQQRSLFRMKKMIHQGGLVVLVSHSLPFLQQFCTRAILLKGGRVIEDGAPDRVIAAYRALQAQ